MSRAITIACLVLAATVTVAQATTIYDIQYTVDPSGDSPLVGQAVTVTGVVTASSYSGFFLADAPGPWNGVFVYTRAIGCGVATGDEVTVQGTVSEYFGMTELVAPITCSVLSTGNPVGVTVTTTAAVAQEALEGVLVRLDSVDVVATGSYGEWTVDDGSGGRIIDDDNDYLYAPAVGDSLDSITGVVAYSFSAWRVHPRTSSDIVSDAHVLHYALLGDVVTMNDTMDVLEDQYVEILADRIVSMSPTPPAGIPVINLGVGFIVPGLIDAHNHPQYNVLGPIPFGRYFEHRDEWRNDPLYGSFGTQLNAIRDYGGNDAQYYNMWKLAEVRALSAGTTMIQGTDCYTHGSDSFGRLGIGIENAGRHPSHLKSQTFPLTYNWTQAQGEYWNRFVVHLSEGTNSVALNEFYTWVGIGLDDRTSVIHGTALTGSEWTQLAAVDGHLIWSPKSNVVLYGATADIPGADAAGVNIAIGTDWTESGSADMLEELRFARTVDRDQWGGTRPASFFVAAATRNAAEALGIGDRLGQVGPGYQANLMVVPYPSPAKGIPVSTYYEAVLDARPADVMLTVVAGKPMYGDPAIMDLFTTLPNVEDVTVCGATKRLALAVDHFAIPESDRPFSQVMSELETAYAAATPVVCEFMTFDPCAMAGLFADGFETGGTAAWSSTTLPVK